MKDDEQKGEQASMDIVSPREHISREQAIAAAKQLLEKSEQLDAGKTLGLKNAAKEALTKQRVFLTPEMEANHPDYSTAHADFTPGCLPCLGGCGFKVALASRFEGYCCGKCWYHANDPEAGKNASTAEAVPWCVKGD